MTRIRVRMGLDGQDELGVFTNAISPAPLSSFEAKLLHPFSSFSANRSPICLLFGSFAAMLTPELLLSFLTLFLETFNYINRPTSVHFSF